MVLFTGILFCIVYGAAVAQTTDNSCQKLHDCIQIAHEQTQQCRNLLTQINSGQSGSGSQCETQMKEKQKDYLDKLTAKNTQLSNCITRGSGAGTAVEDQRQPKPVGRKQNQCRNVEAMQLKPAKSFSDAKDGERAARKQQKQAFKKLKQCLAAITDAKNQCKALGKCCPAAKTCFEEFKSSALNRELEQLKTEMTNAKKGCKPGRQNGGGARRRGGKTDALVQHNEEDAPSERALRLSYKH